MLPIDISSCRQEKFRKAHDFFMRFYTNKRELLAGIKPINFKQGVSFQKIFILAEYVGNCFTYRCKTCRIITVRGNFPHAFRP